MRVARRTFLASAAGVGGGSGRHASRPRRRAESRSSCIMRSRRCRARTTNFWRRGRARSRRRSGGRIRIDHVSLDAARRRAGRICSTRRATASPISPGRSRAHAGAVSRRSRRSNCRFVPSRRALVSSKALEDYAAPTGGRIPRGASDLLFLLRPRRAARQPAGPHHRGDQGFEAARADAVRRRSGARGSARSRADAERAAAAGDHRPRGRRLRRSLEHGADASGSTICSRPTPSFPIRR